MKPSGYYRGELRERQEKGVADLTGPRTTPPQVQIRATSPTATPAPKRVKWVKGLVFDLLAEPGDEFARKIELTAEELDKE